MTRTYRLDRLGWAKAILHGNTWSFKGISRINPRKGIVHTNPRIKKSEHNVLTRSMLACEAFMDAQQNQEIKYIMNSIEHAADWKEFVRDHIHDSYKCPHGTKEQRRAYGTAFRKYIKDEQKKWEWASNLTEWDWVAENIIETTNDLEGIAHWLKEHPVEEVYQFSHEKWIDISDVLVFCPECDEPMEKRNVLIEMPTGGISKHVYGSEDGDYCFDCKDHSDLGDMLCFFDLMGSPRKRCYCPNCGHIAALDSLEGSFIERNHCPPDWPPGAPYPPRRGFLGEPMDVPPWQD